MNTSKMALKPKIMGIKIVDADTWQARYGFLVPEPHKW